MSSGWVGVGVTDEQGGQEKGGGSGPMKLFNFTCLYMSNRLLFKNGFINYWILGCFACL